MKTFKYQTIQFISILVFISTCSMQTIFAQQAIDTTQEEGIIKPLVQIKSDDYSIVRKQFKTKLIKQGGSPQKTQQVDSADIPPQGVTQILFKSGDLTLKAWMNKPDASNKKKYPVVVFLHGGFAFGKGDWDMAKLFRDSGFIVIVPMLRGENGQQGVFTMFYDEVNDAIAAADYARRQSFSDKKRIYLAGHSVGGTITLLTAMATKYFKKAVSFSGSPDQILYCKYGIPTRIIPFDTLNVKEFEVRSPLAYAGSLSVL